MNTQFKAGELIKLVLDRTLSSSANSTSCTKNGTFVARYNRNGSYYNDYSTAQKGIKPGKSCPSSQATTGHTHYILRIVSGNDTNGFFNSGTIATGKIKAS